MFARGTALLFGYSILTFLMGCGGASATGKTSISVMGDSLARGVWEELYRQLKNSPHEALSNDTIVSSGFAKDSVGNWLERVNEIENAHKVDIAVVMIGANDGQNMVVDGDVLSFGTEEWSIVYRQKVDEFLQVLGRSRTKVVWIGLPIPRSGTMREKYSILNRVYREAALSSGGRYIDIWSLFADNSGTYSSYGKSSGGQTRILRKNDGIHFTSAGNQIVVKQFLSYIQDDSVAGLLNE